MVAAILINIYQAIKYLSYYIVLALILVSIPVYSYAQQNRVIEDTGQSYLEEENKKYRQQEMNIKPQMQDMQKLLEEKQVKSDGVCYPINDIKLIGNTRLKNKYLKLVFSPYLKKACVTVGQIKAIMVKLTNLYIKNGYVTSRIYIKKTDLTDKKLEFVAVEGKVASIIINPEDKGLKHLKNKITSHFAFPLLKGKILKLNDFEQGLEQINRLESSNAQVKFYPSKQVGTSDIVVLNQAKDKLRGSIGYDNLGSKITGKNRSRMAVQADDILGINDQLSLTYIGSQNTNAIAGSYRFAYGYFRHNFEYSYSEYLNILDNVAELFGNNKNLAYGLERVIVRGQNYKTSLIGGINIQDSGRIINDVLLTPQNLTIIDFGFSQFYRGSSYNIVADLKYNRGIKALGALEDQSNLPDTAPRAQFNKIDLTLNYNKAISKRTMLSSFMEAQYGFSPLYGSEQIAFGDFYNVRGFVGSPVAGDIGAYVTNDLIFSNIGREKSKIMQNFNKYFQPFIGFDFGTAKPYSGKEFTSLIGSSAGLKINLWRFNGQLCFSLPVSNNFEYYSKVPQIYFNMAMKLF